MNINVYTEKEDRPINGTPRRCAIKSQQMPSENVQKFIDEFQQCLANGTFVKLTLANYKGLEPGLQKLSLRPVETKKGPRLIKQSRYADRETAANMTFAEAVADAAQMLDGGFRSGHLFTAAADLQLTIGKRSDRLTRGKPSFSTAAEMSHDRQKSYIVNRDSYYLKALNITNDAGEVRSQAGDKWRQINKFIETIDGLFENSPAKDKTSLTIVDMGSGKGYLTFAVHDHFRNTRKLNVDVIGIEARQHLAAACSDIAAAGESDGLTFIAGTIENAPVADIDILIALHACDTATDDALYRGISSQAELIIAAPCCHRELRRQMKAPALLRNILKHPTMSERMAEMLTDGMRSLLLESVGYSTKVFEFISPEHTPKNNMIAATKRRHRSSAAAIRDEIERLKAEFGIEHQRLDELLRANAEPLTTTAEQV